MPGQTALDRLSDSDANPNGVFTRTFVPLLRANLTLLDATKAAQEKVNALAKSVNHDQQPAFYDETLGDKACLSQTCTNPTGTAPAPGTANLPPDQAAWMQIASTSDPSALKSFITSWPKSPFKAAAQQKLDEIEVASLEVTPLDEPVWTTDSAVLRSGPGPLFQGLGDIAGDSKLTALGQVAGVADKGSSGDEYWIKAQTTDGSVGFVKRDLILRDWAKQDEAAYAAFINSLGGKFKGSTGNFASKAGLYQTGTCNGVTDVTLGFGAIVPFWFSGHTSYAVFDMRPIVDGKKPAKESDYENEIAKSSLSYYRKLSLTNGTYYYYRTQYAGITHVIGFNGDKFQQKSQTEWQ